ncbi:hypothetical protein GE21DRAFT_1292760 [Neurospora crassa]|nr:hypothetical protein GE21DRAFT_1292760 [Neurospora crassa]
MTVCFNSIPPKAILFASMNRVPSVSNCAVALISLIITLTQSLHSSLVSVYSCNSRESWRDMGFGAFVQQIGH